MDHRRWDFGCNTEGTGRARTHHKPEEIVAKLRQVEVLVGQGKPVAEGVRAIGVTEATYYRKRCLEVLLSYGRSGVMLLLEVRSLELTLCSTLTMTKVGYHRVEVLTGPGRRRRWSVDEKARIVAEASMPGVVVSEVARRWQVCSQQVFSWRREAQRQAVQDAAARPAFVPIVAETSAMVKASSAATIEVKLAGAVVRVPAGTDGAQLVSVLGAVRASVSAA